MTSQTSLDSAALSAFVSRHLRRNFLCFVLDYGMYGVGMAFASTSTIIPALAERLGASNLVIGAIPSITILGFMLPPLLFAHYTERVRSKLGFVLKYTVWERVPMLMLALATFFLAESRPGLVLAAIMLSLGVTALAGGALMPAWMDVIATTIPPNYRGRLMAFSSTIGAGVGLGGAALAGYYLIAFPYPLSYTLCLASAFVFLMMSWVLLALVKEPATEPRKDDLDLRAYMRRLPSVLRGDRDFSWYLMARATSALAGMAGGFYTVFALRELAAPEYEVARFTIVLLAAQVGASMVAGYVADRVSHKPVLLAGIVCTVAGNAVALLAGTVWHMYVVFFLVSVANAAAVVSALNLAVEFAPEGDRPTYVGMATTLMAPLGFASSLLGGLLADSVGYRVVFAVAGLLAIVAALVLGLRVRDPRRKSVLADGLGQGAGL